jgi:hypothetical protein
MSYQEPISRSVFAVPAIFSYLAPHAVNLSRLVRLIVFALPRCHAGYGLGNLA